jgi:hypothetical protein
MKTKEKKPAFLKTFSEFTIAELRTMPVGHVFSLFLEEVSRTFSNAPKKQAQKRQQRAKKNAENPILTAEVKPAFKMPVMHAPQFHVNTTGFSEAMKRVFTIGPVKADGQNRKRAVGKTEKNGKTETVVFSKSSSVN